jgi:CMP-N-acetylneuraminic acid synthetase
MRQEPLVTVYITNHNYGCYLKDAIESISRQTLRSYELLVIDDGSTDNSREIMAEYEGCGDIYLVFQENKGLNATNNVALKMARGKYIVRLDADDYMDEHALEVMSSCLERDGNLALVFPDYYRIDVAGNVTEHVRNQDLEKEVTLLDRPAHGACTMIRADILKEVGGYDEAFSCQDGYDIWLKIAGMYPVKNINLPLFYYRQHEKSLSRGDEKLLDTRARIIAKHVGKKGLKPLSALAVIPVRGSKLDPRSFPLRMLGEKCLLDWTVDAALESGHVKDTVVSTPDDDVLEHIRKRYGSKVIVMKRDAGLARINMSIEGTITEAVDFYLENNKPVDIIMALYVEAPFRTSRYMDKAVNTMQIFDVDVVDGVRPDNSIFYVHDGGGLKQMREQNGLQLERENLYRREGGIHLVKWDFFKKNRKMLDGRIGHIVLDQKAGFMIRTQLDWEMACFMAGERTGNGLVEVS